MARRRGRHRRFRDYRGNPLSTGQKYAIVGVAAVAVGLVGYYVYESQASASTSSGGSTTGGPYSTTLGSSGGPYSTTLGPGGSTTPLAQTNDFEAGSGANAPLVPTSS
jgi:hypothetical protein